MDKKRNREYIWYGTIIICIIIMAFLFNFRYQNILLENKYREEENEKLKEQINILEGRINKQEEENEILNKEFTSLQNAYIDLAAAHKNYEDRIDKELETIKGSIYDGINVSAKEILGEEEYEILAKLIAAEGSILSWKGQVYICSAILNLSEYHNTSIWELAHDVSIMEVAPYVDDIEPTQMQYDVIEYVVCGGGRIPNVYYWRLNFYHNFGTPLCQIENVFFSTL